MRQSAVVFIAAFCLTSIEPAAQSQPALEQLLEKMATYLRDYESQLSSVVDDEVFNQRVVATRAYSGGLPKTETIRRRLESEIGFIRLPIWVDPASGAVWRIEWIYKTDERFATAAPQSSLRVDFTPNDALGMMVPQEMREVFAAFDGLEARGDGVATYRNFRRFGTSARILPPHP